ncbi:hypothetical protein D3C73_1413250 [compost metagenome]
MNLKQIISDFPPGIQIRIQNVACTPGIIRILFQGGDQVPVSQLAGREIGVGIGFVRCLPVMEREAE